MDGQSLAGAIHAAAFCGHPTQEAAFWIAKEALTNVVKHAELGGRCEVVDNDGCGVPSGPICPASVAIH